MRYWLEHRIPNLVGWLARVAHHASGCADVTTATTCWTTLAREARKRNELDQVAELEALIARSLVEAASGVVLDAIRDLDDPDR